MRSQQEAERAEQQRIKNLVLNYDLTDEHDGEAPAFRFVQSAHSKRHLLVGTGSFNRSLQTSTRSDQIQRSISLCEKSLGLSPKSAPTPPDAFADQTGTLDHPHGQPRQDKSGNTRSKQRARKLQLGDIDWYGDHSPSASVHKDSAHSLDGTDSAARRHQQMRARPSGSSHPRRNNKR